MAASLILNKVGTYREVMEMDFEDFVYTYSVFYINSINEKLAMEHKK